MSALDRLLPQATAPLRAAWSLCDGLPIRATGRPSATHALRRWLGRLGRVDRRSSRG